MSAIYFAIPTNAGQARIANAIALGIPLKITHMAIGDGNGQPVTPNPAQTSLAREVRRAPLNTLFHDPLNPAQLVAEQIIPEDTGGWWVREVGLYDDSGTLIAVANTPETYKPLLTSGAGRTQTIRMVLIVSDTSAVELKIDPSVVLATRKYVYDTMNAHKESRNHPDASETEKGFSRHATQEEVNANESNNQEDEPVVTVEKLWGWASQVGGKFPHAFSLWKRLMAEAGYDLIGRVGNAHTIDTADQVLLSEDGTEVYAWTGELPKDMPVDATTENTGGIGPGAWECKSSSVYGVATTDKLATGIYGPGSVVMLSDRGYAMSRVQAGSGANGETILNAGVGLVAVIDQLYYDKVETYSSVQAAFTYAKQLGIKVLRVDSDLSTDEDVSGKGAASLIGNGSLAGVYRKRVARDTDPVSTEFNDINPEVHLKRFLSKSSPVVVIVGDSIATETGANVPTIDTLYHRLKTKIAAAYTDKNITFYNRAIGGETYFTAVGLPNSFPSWYTNHSRGWPAYVGDLKPDLVVFNFGMNDGSNLHTNKLKDYQDLFDNRTIFPEGRPDVIYCTNLTPALDSTYAGFGTESAQRGRDLVAGYTRTFARAVGAGLLDFHRQCTIVKDGYDPTDTALELVGSITPVNGAVSATDHQCTDFKLDLTLTLAVNTNMAVRLGAPSAPVIDAAGRGSYAVIYNNAGNLKVDFFTADIVSDANIYASITTSVAIPSGAFVLSIEKRQNSCVISIDGVPAASFDKLRVAGADVAPKAGNSTYTSGTITAATLWVGRYKTYKPSIINDDMWGASDNAAVQRKPFGGNGANHPSSLGSSAVFQPVLDNADFSGVGDYVGNLTLSNGWRAVSGKMQSKAYRSGKFVCIQFNVQVPTTGVAAKGIIANVPAEFRPPSGISVYGVMQTANSVESNVQCDLSSNGDIQIYGNVDSFAWGSITFVLS